MSVGIPILNSQTNSEVLKLLECCDHENYVAGNVGSAIEKIYSLYERKNKLSFRPLNHFNRDVEYRKIVNMVDKLVAS